MHVGARYYDAQVGRFVSRDTYLDQKPYLYCEHNPTNAVDPSGHDWRRLDWFIWAGGGAMTGGYLVEKIVETRHGSGRVLRCLGDGLAEGGYGVRDVGVTVGCADEPGLERGRGDVDAPSEEGVEEAAV